MPKRRYAIIGTGAVGGFYGAKLVHAGFDVHFLLHSDFEYVCEHGLTVESVDGDIVLRRVQAYANPEDLPPADVVVLALKTTQNHLLPRLLEVPAGRDAVVLVLQNGLGVERQAAEVVGEDRVMGGLCFLCSNKIGPGHIQHLDYGFVTLGEYSPDEEPKGITDRMRSIGSDFQEAGIEIRLAEDLLLERWKKLVWNIPFNGLSVVLDAMIDQIIADPQSYRLTEELMQEVATAASANGRIIDQGFIQCMLDLTRRMKPYRTSMKIDCDMKQPMEIEAIFGNPIRTAKEGGIDCPRIETLYRELEFIDARNQQLAEGD